MDLLARIEELCIPVPWSGCWLWTGRLNDSGYPMLSCKGREYRAHRVSLAGKLKRTLGRHELACHECDVRACCNPEHLFTGTNLENVRDKCAKGRQARVHGPRKLRDGRQAAAIRRAREHGATVPALAARWGLSVRQVQRILAGTRWRPRKAVYAPVAGAAAAMEASA